MRLRSSVLLLLMASAPAAAQGPVAPLRVADWRADLNVLARDLPRFIWGGLEGGERRTFDSVRAALDSNIPALDDDARILGLAAMVAAIGDEQTQLQLPGAWRHYAIGTRWFGCTSRSAPPCELRVITASPNMERYLGTRVLAIDDVAIEEVHRRIAVAIPGGLTKGATYDHSTTLLQLPNVLHGAGVARRTDRSSFLLEDSTGARVTITVPTVTAAEAARPWRRAQQREPFARQRPKDAVWWSMLPDTQNLYVALRGFPDSADAARVADSLVPFLERRRAVRVVFDLRRNSGGDYSAVITRLIPALKRHQVYGRPGRVYALTGPGTLGSGAALALSFREQAGATLVGLPTGTRPEIAADRAQLTLPKSRVVVAMTRESMVGSTEGPVGVQPDHRAETTWTIFHEGRDVALEWAISQPIATPGSGRPGTYQRTSAPKRATPN
jgi:hypothetical protein